MSAVLDTSHDTLTRRERAADRMGNLLARHRVADEGVTDLLRAMETDAMLDAGVSEVTAGSVEALELRHEAMQAAHSVYFAMVGRGA